MFRPLAAALFLAASSTLALPAAAQSLSVLLPLISFPTPAPAPSTKGCVAEAQTTCVLPE